MSCKVVEVGEDARGPKIGCSMKLVDQADGTDLDPQVKRLTATTQHCTASFV